MKSLHCISEMGMIEPVGWMRPITAMVFWNEGGLWSLIFDLWTRYPFHFKLNQWLPEAEERAYIQRCPATEGHSNPFYCTTVPYSTTQYSTVLPYYRTFSASWGGYMLRKSETRLFSTGMRLPCNDTVIFQQIAFIMIRDAKVKTSLHVLSHLFIISMLIIHSDSHNQDISCQNQISLEIQQNSTRYNCRIVQHHRSKHP